MRPILIISSVALLGCPANESDGTDDGVADAPARSCDGIDAITAPVYVAYVIHNEEDDANGVPGSSKQIPDYNGDPAVFEHFATAMVDFATMLSGRGATLSFQPDWTWIEGVQKYRPDFWAELRALPGVEIVPHAHATVVPYIDVYTSLVDAGAEPETILGGSTFDQYLGMQDFFDTNPGFVYWDAPLATPGHTDDKPTPPMLYRIAQPKDTAVVDDLYVHVADSPIIVTPGLPSELPMMTKQKPQGRYLSPSYVFYPTRHFLGEPDDDSLPPIWRKSKPTDRTAAELIADEAARLDDQLLPLVDEGAVKFATVRQVVDLFLEHEPCLDLTDGQDMTGFLAAPP